MRSIGGPRIKARQFTAVDPLTITGGQGHFGETAFPIDLNGDGIVDFVHADPDNTHQILSTLARAD